MENQELNNTEKEQVESKGGVYVNPFTDFGFKRLFGEEANKDLLIDFLNELVLPEHRIVDLSFKNSELQSEIKEERKAVYDIFCKNQNGEEFIVEMQKAYQSFFKDRMVFYSTFPIRTQAKKGQKWNYKLKAIYCIGILDFQFGHSVNKKDEKILYSEEEINRIDTEFNHKVQLKDQYNQVFYNKLYYQLIEMPRFDKKEDELETHFDKWIYFLKHLPDLTEIPKILNEPIFKQAFETAKTANFTETEMNSYIQSLKEYWDMNNVIDSSFEKGEKIGVEKGKIEGEKLNKLKTALTGIEKGFPDDMICAMTQLPIETLVFLKDKYSKYKADTLKWLEENINKIPDL